MSASMLAAIFRDGDIKVIEVERPKPGNGEALLQIEAAAICATDIKIWQRGHRNIAIGSDAILGHEVVGKIVSLGEGLDSNLLGKRFVVAPNVGCGICKICQKGWDSLCLDYRAFGVGLDGGFAQYMLIPSSALHRGHHAGRGHWSPNLHGGPGPACPGPGPPPVPSPCWVCSRR